MKILAVDSTPREFDAMERSTRSFRARAVSSTRLAYGSSWPGQVRHPPWSAASRASRPRRMVASPASKIRSIVISRRSVAASAAVR